MIPDKIFKSLKHSYKGFTMYRNGQEIEPGYKPDLVLQNGNEYIILECENSSSRKTFVGGLIKAAHFLQGEKFGKLIFVLVHKDNTNASVISKHLKAYLNWIQGKTNLKEVFVIETSHYYSNDIVLDLDCDDFMNCAENV